MKILLKNYISKMKKIKIEFETECVEELISYLDDCFHDTEDNFKLIPDGEK